MRSMYKRMANMSIDVFMAELEFREFKIYELERKLARAKRCNKLRRFSFIKRLIKIKLMNKKIQKKLNHEIDKLINFRLYRLARFSRRIKLAKINELCALEEYPLLKRIPK